MEESVTIEFSDEELNAEVQDLIVEPKGNENEESKEQSQQQQGNIQQEQTKPDGSNPASAGEEGGQTPESDLAPVAKTDAELAVIHGVSEEDIRYAKNMGWSPKEHFRGNPGDWKGPKEFIDIAEQSAPVLRERLREMSKKVQEMQKSFPVILEMQQRELQNRVESLTEQNKGLEEQLKEAHLLADSKRAAEIAEKMVENRLKIALTEEEKKHVGEKMGIKEQNGAIVPDHIDVEKERAWRDSIWPRLTMEQREIYKEAVDFVTLPQNADQTTDQRIAYIEGKLFGSARRSAPVAAPVARPTATNVTESSAPVDEYAGWNALSSEEKKIATSMLEDTDWYQKRDSDPQAKAKWNEFRKQFRR
jgi:hypothetical protein